MGRIQSIQSFSTFDGPGTRSVVFLQGCPMGCIFCHNPESWDFDGGEEVDVASLLRRLDRFRPFLHDPGLTVSGGEPLAQPDFTMELVKQAKFQGWHVAVDTSGCGPVEKFQKISEAADLIIFSIKHPSASAKLAPGINLEKVKANLGILPTIKTPVWLRYVIIPGFSDEPESLKALGGIAKEIPNLERLDLLPLNNLAKDKWAKIGKVSPIFSGEPLQVSEAEIRRAEEVVSRYRMM